jgi:hypothetical protein
MGIHILWIINFKYVRESHDHCICMKTILLFVGLFMACHFCSLAKGGNTGGKVRQFYVIGNNPNTAKKALLCLIKGANAIRPDVDFDPAAGQFYMSESKKTADRVTVGEYLDSLKSFIEAFNLKHLGKEVRLSLIIFNLKPPYPDYKVTDLFTVARAHFAVAPYSKVSILVTVNNSLSLTLFSSLDGFLNDREAVGVDQGSKNPGEENDAFGKMKVSAYTYATRKNVLSAGSSVKKIKAAVRLRDNGNSFKLVYVWTVNGKSPMKKYLNIEGGIDGIVTDNPFKLINTLRKYSGGYHLATSNYQPFKK